MYGREADHTNFNGDYVVGGCSPCGGTQINANFFGDFLTFTGYPITAGTYYAGNPNSGSSSMHVGVLFSARGGFSAIGTGLIEASTINDSTNARDTLTVYGAHNNTINTTNATVTNVIAAAQGQKACFKGSDGCLYSAAGSNNFSFDMGGSRALQVVGGQANGVSITSAATGFGPTVAPIGSDAILPLNLASKGGALIQALNPMQISNTGDSGYRIKLTNAGASCEISPTTAGLSTSCPSDARLKRDIVPTGPALPHLLDMQIRDYTVKADGTRHTGPIAQELETTHPDMVREGQDGMLAVEAPNPWLMVKAIQELKADNDNLRTRQAEQQARSDQLLIGLGVEGLGLVGLAGFAVARRRTA